jgi:hypothetical protein
MTERRTPETQQMWATAQLGLHPSHNYGLMSRSFGAGAQFQDINTLVQSYNAPTYQALYGTGNDPNARFGTVSRPGAGWMWSPLDFGGNVTLEHGDGYARNTTIPYQHPLEGTITRNLVADLHEGGGYQVMTLGRGEGGAQLASLLGSLQGPLGGLQAQNQAHMYNPELGRIAFGQLDRALIAAQEGAPNPNTAAPQGQLTELGNMWDADSAGRRAVRAGQQPAAPTGDLVADLARTMNQRGAVDGFFMRSSNGRGVYHVGPHGSTYYERGEDGRPVERQVDEWEGADAAIEREQARATSRPDLR